MELFIQCRLGRIKKTASRLLCWVKQGSKCDSLTPWLNPLTALVDVLALAVPSDSFLALWAAFLYMQLTTYRCQNHIYKQASVAASPMPRDSSSPWIKLKGALVFPRELPGPWQDHSEAMEVFCLFWCFFFSFLTKVLLYNQGQVDFFYKYCNNGHKWGFPTGAEHHLSFKCW